MSTQVGASLLQLVFEMQDRKTFQELNWTGSFSDYLELMCQNSTCDAQCVSAHL